MGRLDELLKKRRGLEDELVSLRQNDPETTKKAEMAALDKAIKDERERMEKLDALDAKKRAAAKIAYRQACRALIQLENALDELGANQVYPSSVGKMPGLFIGQVRAAADFLRTNDPEAMGLPPRPSPEQVAAREKELAEEQRAERIKRLKEMAEDRSLSPDERQDAKDQLQTYFKIRV